MRSLGLLWHTVRHLRAEQIAYQLYYRIARGWVAQRARMPVATPPMRPWVRPWQGPLVGSAAQLQPGVFRFLGEVGTVSTAADWNAPDRAKLWLYNLHYLDDLNAHGADVRADWNEALIERWMQDNPPMMGNGWEPYPLSLRIVNLVKWYACRGGAAAHRLQSLAQQAHALSLQVERHLLANHLFANGKALTFVGAFFSGAAGQAWLRQGLNILDREVREQFLPDGGHFERSPMYHTILLWDVCDLIHLADCSALVELQQRVDLWRAVLERGLAWLRAMCHPDGDIAFFNDAAFEIAPPPHELYSYAKRLGCGLDSDKDKDWDLIHLQHSGYIAVGLGDGHKAILDVGEVGPDYQPGHTHADTLSFELSLYGQRVLVNSGTSTYAVGRERHRQRGTAAHNTVEVDGQDSTEVWAAFRVARRAHPVGLVVHSEDEGLSISCAHDGYRRLSGRPLHLRSWRVGPGKLRVQDSVSGRYATAVARYYLHPEVKPLDKQRLQLPSGQYLDWTVEGAQARLVATTWHPRFGEAIPNRCIELCFDRPEVTMEFMWA